MRGYSISKAVSESKNASVMCYLAQNNETIHCFPLPPIVNADNLEIHIAKSLYFNISLALLNDEHSFYSKVDINNNLHVSIETTSELSCIFDTHDYRIPSCNPVLAIGNTEESLLSYTLLIEHFFKFRHDTTVIDPYYMYRKFLHLGKKPQNSLQFFKDSFLFMENLTKFDSLNIKPESQEDSLL